MQDQDYRLSDIKKMLSAKGIMAHYLRTNHMFAAKVWAREETFKLLLPKHELSGGYYLVELEYAYKTLLKKIV